MKESKICNYCTVSIITVIYNEHDKIEETILSVINQLNENIEYIIIDGGSNDGTIDIIKKYEDRITYWVSEPDKGVYDAMNKAIELAKGTWITNINAGDRLILIPVNDLERASTKMYDALCGKVETENNNIIIPKFNWSINLFNSLPHQGLYYRKESLYSKYELQYKIFADFAYNIGMYQRNQKIYLSNQIVAFHSIKGISNNPKSNKELFRVIFEKGGIIKLIISYMYFKWQGLKKRIIKMEYYD